MDGLGWKLSLACWTNDYPHPFLLVGWFCRGHRAVQWRLAECVFMCVFAIGFVCVQAGGMHITTALQILIQVGDGLAALHALNLNYRNLRGCNVLVASLCPVVVKVSDYLFCRHREQTMHGAVAALDAATDRSSSGSGSGSLSGVSVGSTTTGPWFWLPPEHLRAVIARGYCPTFTPGVDVYMFGGLMFEVLTGGQRPFFWLPNVAELLSRRRSDVGDDDVGTSASGSGSDGCGDGVHGGGGGGGDGSPVGGGVGDCVEGCGGSRGGGAGGGVGGAGDAAPAAATAPANESTVEAAVRDGVHVEYVAVDVQDSDVGRDLVSLMHRCLAAQPSQRPDLAAVNASLADLLARASRSPRDRSVV